ncbi:MAG: hypothetical protein ACYTG4_13195 [Planctomycetota bacterium]|jgi:hypothetical protein
MPFTNYDIDFLRRNLSYFLNRWQRYPLAFAIEACQGHKYGYPTHQQAMILNAMRFHPLIAVASGHCTGKSRLLAWAHWRHLVCNKRFGTPLKACVTGPRAKQVDTVMWPEIGMVHGHLLPFLADRFEVQAEEVHALEPTQDPWMSFKTTATKENADNLSGMHGTPQYIIDEAAAVHASIFEVAMGALGDEGACALIMGNPTKLSGYFYDQFHMPPESCRWHTMQISSTDSLTTETYSYPFVLPNGDITTIETTGRCTPEWIRDQARDYGEESPVYCARVLGTFPESADSQLIPRGWVKSAFDREFEEEDKTYDRVLGIDVADMGNDANTAVMRKGNVIEDVQLWHNEADIQDAFHRCCLIIADSFAADKPIRHVMVDRAGVGAGLYSQLREWALTKFPTLSVYPVIVNEKPPDDGGTECAQLRDWLWWKTRTYFRDSKPIMMHDTPTFRRLEEDLTVLSYDLRNGKVKVESKLDVRKRGRKSPDAADALILTFYAEMPALAGRAAKKKADAYRRARKLNAEAGELSWKTV